MLVKGTTAMTVFSKDKGAFADVDEPKHILCGVQATNPKPELRITNDLIKTSSDTLVGTTDLPAGWNYVVYSVEMVLGKNSNLAIFVNNIAEGTKTALGIFVRDLTGYEAYVALHRTGATAYAGYFNGFIYEFHIWQKKYTIATKAYKVAGCSSDTGCNPTCSTGGACMLNDDWGNHGATGCSATVCNATDCRNASDCTTEINCAATGGDLWCNQCHDRECRKCTNYAAGSCTLCQITATNSATTNTAGECDCADGYGRPTIRDEYC
jgi:hypothetical protein